MEAVTIVLPTVAEPTLVTVLTKLGGEVTTETEVAFKLRVVVELVTTLLLLLLTLLTLI